MGTASFLGLDAEVALLMEEVDLVDGLGFEDVVPFLMGSLTGEGSALGFVEAIVFCFLLDADDSGADERKNE